MMFVEQDQQMIKGSLNQQAYTLLRESIASLQLKPGVSVSENGLAEQLGMSRSPIRQALKQLEHDGLVVTLPQRGTMITKLHEKDSRDAVAMRILLESWAVEQMKLQQSHPDVHQLSHLLDYQAEAAAAGEYNRFLQVDSQFHASIIAGAGNGAAVDLFNQVNVSILRVRAWTLRRLKDLEAGVKEHRSIYQAIVDMDWDRVNQLLMDADNELLRAVTDMKATEPDLF
jgi:DNA-binding GntR family transcriptional regulator